MLGPLETEFQDVEYILWYFEICDETNHRTAWTEGLSERMCKQIENEC